MNLIEATLKENIKNQNAFFIFPTQTAADLWADRITLVSEVSAVAMERFIAWDKFKGESIKSQHQDKTSIPSILRQIFTAALIKENQQQPFLKNLIVPEYASNSSGFLNWLSQLLPGLASWKTFFENSHQTPDDEDLDLLEIYNRYKEFLDAHNLFDPAWETPPFAADGNHYFIFFPEILSDYLEYEPILKSSEDITIINLPEEGVTLKPEAFLYNNSRTELKALGLKLLELHEEKNIPWDEIAINVPDLDTYGPYLDRELSLFQIPHVMRYAKPLTASGAGEFFNQLQQCVSGNFNFDSLKNLLLNTELPWIRPELNSALIAYGQENNCICSFNYNGKEIDIWEESFKNARPSEDLLNYYVSLKKAVTKLVSSKTFAEIRDNYFALRNKHFDMSKCPEETDLIISRCISELGAFIDIQESFPDCQIPSPYSFFVNYLNSTKYLKQTDQCGVQIIPYKLAATAPFKAHLIIDSSQAALSVIYKPLSFLRDDKRKKLFGNKDDPNVTEKFIRLYRMNSVESEVYFSISLKNFTGYSQVSSYLKEVSKLSSKDLELIDSHKNNYFKTESQWFIKPYGQAPEKLTELQLQGFNFWKDSQNLEKSEVSEASLKVIEEKIKYKRFTPEGLLKVSNTNLKKFYECPRAWLINSITSLEQQDNEAELMNPFAVGNLYHKIFELYLQELKERNLLIHEENDSLTDEYKSILLASIPKAIDLLEDTSFLEKELLRTVFASIQRKIEDCVLAFSKIFEGFMVAEIEAEYKVEDSNLKINCSGRIDCLLQEPGTGDYTLVDFKTTNNAVPSNFYVQHPVDENGLELPVPEILEEQALPDFQMPLYIYLLQNSKEKPKTLENCCFFTIKEHALKPVAGSFEFTKAKNFKSMEDFNEEVSKTLECVEHFAQRIKNKDFKINNNVQTFHTCNQCDYRAMCRRVFNVSKKD